MSALLERNIGRAGTRRVIQPDVLGHDSISYRNETEWSPNPGPQEMAFHSEADIVGYGGAAGGGKSDLLLGKAFTQFQKSIIFRRRFTDLVDIVNRGDEIQAGRCSFVWGIKRRWDTPDGRQVELGAVEHDRDKSKYRGRPHDGILIDEAPEFPESVVRFLLGWLRTVIEGQKTQVVLTFNPPGDPEGEWIIKFFAPWIDPTYSGIKAEPGELRWFVYAGGQDVEVLGSDPVTIDGKEYAPKSRTFIPARLEDNPYLMATEYGDQLLNLPEPLRSQLRYGDFTIGAEDDVWQTIPTGWVLQAQERRRSTPKPDVALRGIGNDVAHGGADNTVIGRVYGVWFDDLLVYPGGTTPDGDTVAKYVNDVWDNQAPIAVDAVGYGASACDTMKGWGMQPLPVNFGAISKQRDRSQRFEFFNLRAQAYWELREALDPQSDENLCLPDDRDIRVELCAVRFKIVRGKIQLEPKDDVKKRIGRSPDKADTIVLTWYAALHGALIDSVVLDW